ncbi:uncharacterized protein c19orf29 [Stylonychia lemnae]|uniref:Splicing factor Cactin n=1 Tax=Stylonychia lemnae TaxID=5949 RepID=A0A077ZR39_STYLE|nr:uncharacterized protein c19orf29 [Stylonychia lemnae]|eukprot:CDW72357.1 uncharacterized protein c19orf29 [Stylonychia lemnae]
MKQEDQRQPNKVINRVAAIQEALVFTVVIVLDPIKICKKLQVQREEFQRTQNFHQKDGSKPNMNDPNVDSFEKWKAKEELFHLEQAILRSKLRIQSNREQPIDFLAKIILIIENKLPICIDFLSEDYKESYRMLDMLGLNELEELLKEIEIFQSIDKTNQRFQNYWQASKILCEMQYGLKKKQMLKEQSDEPLLEDANDKLVNNEELDQEANEMINDKSIDELIDLHKEIQTSLTNDRSFAIEMQYWQNLLKRIKIKLAQLNIQKIYQDYVDQNRDKVENEVKVLQEAKVQSQQKTKEKSYQQPFTSLTIDNIQKPQTSTKQNSTQMQINTQLKTDKKDHVYNDGELSPALIPFEDAGFLKSIAITDEQDAEEQEKLKRDFINKQIKKLSLESDKVDQDLLLPSERVKKTALNTLVRFDIDAKGYETTSNAMYDEIRRKGLGVDEVEFTDIVSHDFDKKIKYDWEDKYKPRKPKFFNSVLTGYEWNKYNQTHYDADNPPPKIVQGYKFNIFYPDLIDKTKTPQNYLEQSDSPDTLIIRFHAGPPYEDIAFKIINREWEMSERHGFRNVFDRGVLQLYFNFKKHRYRR